jgi:hypothetical protein
MIHDFTQSLPDDLSRLHKERAQLAEIIERDAAFARLMMRIAIPIVVVVMGFLIGAVAADQLSIWYLVWAAVLAGPIVYLLSREYRRDGRAISVLDLLLLQPAAHYDMSYIKQRLVECDRKIAALTAGTAR